MSIQIKRSPARVCWWLVLNNIVVCTADTRSQAEQERARLEAILKTA